MSRLIKLLLTCILTSALLQPGRAQTWFTDPLPEPVKMLRELFAKPVSEWKSILQHNRSILDDEFFEKVSKRIDWGLQEGHIDDALRFAQVGDLAGEVQGRDTNFRSYLNALLRKAIEPEHFGYFPSETSLMPTISLVFSVDEDYIERTALWESWPDSNEIQRRQRELVAGTLRTPLSQWEDLLHENREFLDDSFFAFTRESIESALAKGDYERAALFALLGDSGASAAKRKRPRLGLLVTKRLGGAPLVLDRRDDISIQFPGASHRSSECVVPWIDNRGPGL